MHMNATTLKRYFDAGIDWEDFVQSGAPMGHDGPWRQRYEQLAPTPAQQALVRGFSRTMHVLCLTGTWCGDCALQGTALHRIAECNPDRIQLRFILRSDEHAELIVQNQINAGFRVPVTWFMAEDYEPVSRIGDRSLSRYRSMARKALGDEHSNVLAPPPENPVTTVMQEMLDEFERVHLLLRLSGRLRQLHGD